MGDIYVEQIVKRKKTKVDLLKKILLIIAVTLSIFLGLGRPLWFILTIILIVVSAIVFRNMNIEYEYIYFNGELDIDRICGKQSRKRVYSTDINEVLVVAPLGSLELQQYRKEKGFDYSSKRPEANVYELVSNHRGKRVKIAFEPNEKMLKGMHMMAPRKVFM